MTDYPHPPGYPWAWFFSAECRRRAEVIRYPIAVLEGLTRLASRSKGASESKKSGQGPESGGSPPGGQ